MSSVLIAEGEPRIASFVKKGLEASGFTTLVATDGDEAIAMCRRLTFDLVVLDAALAQAQPGLVQDLRNGGRVPVVMLTTRDLVAAATDASIDQADEYLRKPFRMSELLARVSRRVRPRPHVAPVILRRHGATFDRQNRRLTLEGRILDLTPREAALTDLVFRDADQELTAEQLLTRLRSLLT
jgi:two-component system, OmpR family, copper resistance phosphate regulon response regulator CusR